MKGLFDGEEPDEPPLERAFREFHAENPQVYRLFSRFAHEALQSGRKRFGARMIWERMRWHTQVETSGPDTFKLNDHHPPYYARMFLEDHPEYEGLFELRKVQT